MVVMLAVLEVGQSWVLVLMENSGWRHAHFIRVLQESTIMRRTVTLAEITVNNRWASFQLPMAF